MIEMIDGYDHFATDDTLRAFFRLRHRVFRERLGWDCNVVSDDAEMERDEFDTGAALYMVVRDGDGEASAGLRLLQTTGKYLLGDYFGDFIDESIPRDENILEVTRLVVDPSPDRRARNSNLLRQLVWGLQSYGVAAGIDRYVSLSYVGMERILRASGCRFRRLGPPRPVDGRICVALEFEVSAEIRNRCADSIGSAVMPLSGAMPAFLAAAASDPRHGGGVQYAA